ncbi:uncharacterized protein E0L32_004045 [Thyridium curvatum]|uniref:Glycosyl transferase family 25 domain-containing protein n=1 Tax=Thyridium curvatum TaxID=1093900 RepID=A0A507BAZ1_9PEZI|nr:uncharacterized protein E0L32_004045 [Thyridium curvatum]TPX16396.1 hypothetical protein E0L32_004045 [Thyridium curvatum]
MASSVMLFFKAQVLSGVVPGVTSFLPPSSSPGWAEDINNATLGFQKVFVVGLPSRTDRRDGMLLQASLSDVDIEFVDGILGKDINEKAIPQTKKKDENQRMGLPVIGSWRAHMNAIHEVVRRNLSSALILEDDVDWDVRIREQLRDFAFSTNALTQPLRATPSSYSDPTFPTAPSDDSPAVSVADISFHHLPAILPPRFSPYGDNWDVLWIGHCGMHFPAAGRPGAVPRGRVIHSDDVTVPERRYLWTLNDPFTLKDQYPEHTRAAHHVQEGVCTLGYAVTQKAARQILHEIALRDVSDAFDITMRFFCEGVRGHRRHTCLTVQPALFHHHRPAGPAKALSDIGDHGDEFRETASTDMVRWSVRMNADVLLEGRRDFWDVIDLIQGANANGMVQLGRQFLSAAYLMASYDTGKFQMRMANPTNDQNLVAVTEKGFEVTDNFCAADKTPTDSGTGGNAGNQTDPKTGTPVARSKSGTPGVISGVVIAVLAIVSLIGIATWFFLKRRKAAVAGRKAAVAGSQDPSRTSPHYDALPSQTKDVHMQVYPKPELQGSSPDPSSHQISPQAPGPHSNYRYELA